MNPPPKRKLESSVTSSKRPKLDNGTDIVHISPKSEEQKIFLNSDNTSWIRVVKLEPPIGLDMDEFEQLYQLKPATRLNIKIAGRMIECPRYSKSYLRAYNFSGLDHEAEMNMPPRLAKLLKDCQSMNPSLNQSLVNWYESDGSIGKHSDDTRQLLPDSEIFSLSFGPTKRTFIIEPRLPIKGKKVYIKVQHNTLIIMGGKCQSTHVHHVPKQCTRKNVVNERRLNVTFRCFK